jgi:predicted secreted protein
MGEIFLKAFEALWQVLVVGVILGAGLPALFALGIKAQGAGRTLASDGTTYTSPPTGAGRAGSTVLFAICVAAVLFGIFLVVATGFGLKILGS